jgi:hypothetical protein
VTRAALHGGTPLVWSPHSYANSSFREEGYQCVVVSSKNLGQTRLPPVLRHVYFAYQLSAPARADSAARHEVKKTSERI